MKKRILALLVGTLLALLLDWGIRQIYLALRKKPSLTHVWSLRQTHPVYHHGLKPNAAGMDIYGPFSA